MARTRWILVFLVAALASVAFSGCIGDEVGPSEEDEAPQRHGFTFRPEGMTGDLALMLEITTETFAECNVTEEMAGLFRDSKGGVGTFSFNWGPNHTYSAAALEDMPAVHHGEHSTSDHVKSVLFQWSGGGGFDGNVTPTEPYRTFTSVFGVSDRKDVRAFFLDVSCDSTAEIRLWAATEALHPLTPHGMKGGSGANMAVVQPPGPVPPAPVPRLNHGDRAEYEWDHELVFFAAALGTDGLYPTDGTLYLEHPEGREEWSLGPEVGQHVHLMGSAGSYALGLDMVSLQSGPPVYGVLAGLDRIEPEDLYTITGTTAASDPADASRKG